MSQDQEQNVDMDDGPAPQQPTGKDGDQVYHQVAVDPPSAGPFTNAYSSGPCMYDPSQPPQAPTWPYIPAYALSADAACNYGRAPTSLPSSPVAQGGPMMLYLPPPNATPEMLGTAQAADGVISNDVAKHYGNWGKKRRESSGQEGNFSAETRLCIVKLGKSADISTLLFMRYLIHSEI